MASDHETSRYKKFYSRLIRIYPKRFRARFGEGMEQTFSDLCRERKEAGKELFTFVLWLFAETTAGIIRARSASMLQHNKRLIGITVAITMLLMVPLVARFPWSAFDFVAAGILLYGTGFTFEFVVRKARNAAYRMAFGVALGAALLLTWVNLAVGVIGSENNPANLLYFVVLQVGFIGAAIARFQPRGMARALFATAIAQALVPLIALISWRSTLNEPPGVLGVFVLNGFFVALFVLSASLFQHAAITGHREEKATDD